MLTRIKVVNGYTADARWFAETRADHLGYIPRQSDIPSPFAYSPSHIVWEWRGRAVIHVETKHRRYEIFEVPRAMIQSTEKEIIAALVG